VLLLHQGWHENINDMYQRYHDSIMIFSNENIMILKISTFIIIINNYYLLTFLIHAYLTQTAHVPSYRWCKKLPTILTLWV